jgi:hypothetical protein
MLPQPAFRSKVISYSFLNPGLPEVSFFMTKSPGGFSLEIDGGPAIIR